MKIAKFFIPLLTCLIFLGCEENPQIQPSKERIQDINEIVKAIIIQDSVLDKIYGKSPTWFCIDLQKVNLYPRPQYDSGELSIPPPPEGKYYEDLLQVIGLNNDSFFISEDTFEFKVQSKYPNFIRLDTNYLKLPYPISYDSSKTMHRKGQYKLYDFNIPIFSKDGQKALVYSGYYCPGLCGRGKAYYLRKVENGWKIVHRHITWVS